MLQFLNSFIHARWLGKIINSEKVFTFITTNYVLTIVLYLAFELLSGNPTFGLYASVPLAWHNFGTNILVHFGIGAFAIINFFRFKPTSSTHRYYYFSIGAYLISYFTIVKITGKYCYLIEWYPYFIFDAAETWKIFHLPGNNHLLQVLFLLIICSIIFVLYFLLYNALMKWKRHIEISKLKKNFK